MPCIGNIWLPDGTGKCLVVMGLVVIGAKFSIEIYIDRFVLEVIFEGILMWNILNS